MPELKSNAREYLETLLNKVLERSPMMFAFSPLITAKANEWLHERTDAEIVTMLFGVRDMLEDVIRNVTD
jgi:hypothetical protein